MNYIFAAKIYATCNKITEYKLNCKNVAYQKI